MAETASLPPPDSFGIEDDKPVEECPMPAPKPKARRSSSTEEAKAPIDQSALQAAMQLLAAAGMEVVAKPQPKGPCPNDPLTGRKGYYQTTTDAQGRQHTVRVYSGFDADAKGVRKEPTISKGRGRK